MARTRVPGIQITFKSADGADLSVAAKQYTFVKMTANQRINTCTAGGSPIGVMEQLGVGLPQSVNVQTSGKALLKVAGLSTAIAAQDRLKSDGSGRGVKVSAATDNAGAIALEGADADDIVIEVLLITGGAAAA